MANLHECLPGEWHLDSVQIDNLVHLLGKVINLIDVFAQTSPEHF